MIKTAAVFADYMVLQAGKPVRVFGTCDGDEGTITVTVDGFSAECKPEGKKWMAELAAHGYGEGYTLEVYCGEDKISFNDVCFGDVIMCSGQSNIQFTMSEEVTPSSEYVDDPMLRLFTQTRPEKNSGFSAADGWKKCLADEVGAWSALGYLIGVRIRRATGHAVGVLVAAQGASAIQSWMSEKSLSNPLFDIPYDKLFYDHHYEVYKQWNGYSMLYHFMFEPLMPLSIGTVVWYQGESNASPAEGEVYYEMLSAMIDCWREADLDEKLPFIVVQIADTRTDEGWLAIQAAQARLESEIISGVKLVRCGDICEKEMIHPVTKHLLADRIVETMSR